MQYLLFVRVDPALGSTEDERAAEDGADLGAPVLAARVEGPESAVLVRVREGRVERVPGAVAPQPEPIAGVELREARDLEEALDAASRHPAAALGAIEVREVLDDFLPPGATGLPRTPPDGVDVLFLHGSHVGGVPAVPATALPEWVRDVEERGATLGGARLRDAGSGGAAVVRRRHGEVLIARGPSAELAEQIGGVDLIRAADLDDAVRIAAAHPTALLGAIEIRPLLPR